MIVYLLCCMTCGDDDEYLFQCSRCRITYCSDCDEHEIVEHLANCFFTE
jgi:hypothetical protein